jgi:nitroreductase
MVFKCHTPFVPTEDPGERARAFYDLMSMRRTVREFSDKPVPEELIRTLIATAGTAPSGANKQPWQFVAIKDPTLKHEIRLAAEEEEREFYTRRASPEYLQDLAPLETSDQKPYIDVVPWLIAVFKLVKDPTPNKTLGASDQVYYVNESVGIAVGMFLAAAQNAGLSTLTHTPNPMRFLGSILRRPAYERPYLLIGVGYPAEDCAVPDIQRKSLDEIIVVDRPELPTDD